MGGNASSVVGLCFSPSEEQLLSASEGGSLKIFDLGEGRVNRSLNGHLAKVNGCDYHPYGEFIVSGGDDTNVKVWDVRHKRCIQTYKGHTRYVTDVGFSPDGQWVASCSKLDGTVKIWDLIAGKMIHSFEVCKEGANNGPTNFEFNPSEFLMAVTAGDSVVKFLDMEKFTLMSSTPNDPSKVNRICWYDPGTDAPATLLSSTNDCIRQWEVDPNVRCESWADARWGGGVMDMVVNQSKQLVVGTVKDEYFSVHAVELENLPKRGGMVGRAGAGVGGLDGQSYEPSLRSSPGIRERSKERDRNRDRANRTPTQSNLGEGIVGVGVGGSSGARTGSVGKKKREGGIGGSAAYRRTPSPQQKYTVESPPSSEAKPGGRRLQGGDYGGRIGRESPVPPTYHYNDERKDDREENGGEDDVVMPNEYKKGIQGAGGMGRAGGGGSDSDDDFLSDTAAMNIVDAVVASAPQMDADDSMSPSFTSLNSSNTSNDDSSKANLSHIYDFAAAMGAATPYGGSPTKDGESASEKRVFPSSSKDGVSVGDFEDAIVAAKKAAGRRAGRDAEKENDRRGGSLGNQEEKEVSFGNPEREGNELNYNLPVSTFHGGPSGAENGHMEDGSMDDQVIGQILLGRLGLSTCLGERIEKLEKLRKIWGRGDLREALLEMENIVEGDSDGSMEGAAVVVDFLKCVDARKLRLEDCGRLLRVLIKIILGGDVEDGGDMEETIGGSSTAIRGRPFAGPAMGKFATILESFGRLVFETCLSGGSGFGVGVDVEGEGRLKRCLACHESFAKLADRMCGGSGEEKSGEVSSVVFMGLIDTKDREAKREVKRLAGLLAKYRSGKM